ELRIRTEQLVGREASLAAQVQDARRAAEEKDGLIREIRDAAAREVKLASDEARDLRARIEELVSNQATLSTQVEEVRKLAAEKAKLLEKAQQELVQAFEAISGNALNANSESFLLLANSQRESFQQNAAS